MYGVLAHKAQREQPAHGVRLALGARPSNIAGLVGREAARMAATGLAAGALLAVLGGRLIQGLLFRTPPTDVLAFVVAALLVSIAVAAAALGPAWQASRVDPMEVLRRE
jgi:ABC-type antimicrobial peptide transport system permease subunit